MADVENAFYDARHNRVARIGIANPNHKRIGEVFSKKCHSVALEKGRMKACIFQDDGQFNEIRSSINNVRAKKTLHGISQSAGLHINNNFIENKRL